MPLSFEDYAAALAEQRTLERVDTEDIRDEFAALVEQKKQGEAIDLEAFVQSKYEALQARYRAKTSARWMCSRRRCWSGCRAKTLTARSAAC